MMNTNISPHLFGMELEYAGVDSSGSPVSTIDGTPLVDAFLDVVDPKILAQINRWGGLKEEVFKHQRELFTSVGTYTETVDKAVCLHQIVMEQMKSLFGVMIAETSGTVPFPGGGFELLSERDYYIDSMKKVNSKGHLLGLVTPRDYYVDAISDIADQGPEDFSKAWNASTSSTHLHMSGINDTATMQLCYALIHHYSKAIESDPDMWWEKWGMSPERHDSWSYIVDIRSKLGEVMEPRGSMPLIDCGTMNWKERMLARYFNGDHGNLSELEPSRDHGPVVLKKPTCLTAEMRTADGPGSDYEKILGHASLYKNICEEALQTVLA